MVGEQQLVAFVASANAERAKTFYGETLGLRFIIEDEFALVFDANGTTLRIQKVTEVSPAPYTSLGWNVSNIAAAVEQLSKSGVSFERYPFTDQNGIWTAPGGGRIAWFKDPDGNLLSIAQLE